MATVSPKKTLLWTLLLLALAAFYYFYEIEGEKKRQEATRQQELLFHFAADAVTTLTVKRADETITAVKRAGHWQLTAPLSTPGDGQKYHELIRTLAELRYQRLIEEHPETLAPFGLTTPSVEIHVHVSGQTPPLALRLGDKAPTGNGYYVQVAGHPAVYVISATARDVLDVSLYDLRDKTVVTFDPGEVQEVHVAFDTLPPVVLQQQNDAWQLTTPVIARADEPQVRTLLQQLRNVKIQAFVADDPAELAQYGLHMPTLRLTVVVGQDRVVHTLLLGKLDTDRQGVYAKRADTTNVFLLPQSFWNSLPKTPAALRDKTILPFDRERITRLELLSADNRTIITRAGPRQYKLEQPVSAEGDSEAISRLLGELQELKAKDFTAETSDDLATYGLASPRFQVTLWEEASGPAQDVRHHTLHFGNAASDTQGVYVRVAERPTIYLVDSLAAQRLMDMTAVELRNKKILAFDPATIQKIRLQYPTSTFTLERHGDTWRFSEPKKQAIEQQQKVEDVLHELSTLEYATLVADTPADTSGYGLDTPQVQITLWSHSGAPVGPLTIGKATDTSNPDHRMVFAQVAPHTSLYTLRADFLDGLAETLDDLTAE
jgi:hypothetical protein